MEQVPESSRGQGNRGESGKGGEMIKMNKKWTKTEKSEHKLWRAVYRELMYQTGS